jgi:hypothetical protein
MGVFAMLSLSACAEAKPNDTVSQTPSVDGAAAVWELQSGQRLTAFTTGFTALVSRLECNNGITGAVMAPNVQIRNSEIVVTFQVEPKEPGGADCQGNEWVPYEVTLNEPIGDRALIDGQCLPGWAAEQTSFCDPDPRRWTP